MNLPRITRARVRAGRTSAVRVVSTIAVIARPAPPGRRRRESERLRSAPAVAVGMSVAALTLGLVPGVASAQAARAAGVGVPCNTAALVTAIKAANASPLTPTTLDLARHCTYLLTAIDNTSQFGPNGLPVIVSQQLTINGHDAVIKRSATAPRFRILEVGSSGRLILKDVTITGGDGGDGSAAGGILNGGTLAVTHSQVSNNTFTAPSGTSITAAGVGIENSGGATLTLRSVRITGNTSQGDFASGGGIKNSGTATVTDSLIGFNTVTSSVGGNGGGIANSGHMLLDDSRITGNVLRGNDVEGGGISNDVYPQGDLRVQSSSIDGNAAIAEGVALGGGIANLTGGASVVRSSVSNNTASATGQGGQGGQAQGGGIFISDFANASVDRSSISTNTATATGADSQAHGGGISSVGAVHVDRSSVSNNTASATGQDGQGQGGGIWMAGLDGQLFLEGRSSVSTNTATATGAGGSAQGGGISNTDGATLLLRDDSEVTQNTATAPHGTADGGGIFNDANSHVVISDSVVAQNKPNNCGGPGTPIAGCTG